MSGELCGVIIGQEQYVGAGLFISCQNERPCMSHPMPRDNEPRRWTRAEVGDDAYDDLLETIDPGDDEQ